MKYNLHQPLAFCKWLKEYMRSGCPISHSLDIIGDKWTLLILRDIIFENKQSYGEFIQSDEKIASNILANRLLKLEEEGILLKTVSAENKSKYIYSLTEKGISTVPLLVELIVWGTEIGKNKKGNEAYKKIVANKTKFIKDLTRNLTNKVPLTL